MAKDDYIPRDDAGRVTLLSTFRDAVGSYATQLGLSAGDLAAQAVDAEWAHYVFLHSGSMKASAKQWNTYRTRLFLGGGVPTVPLTPPLPTPVPEVTTLAPELRLRKEAEHVVVRWKKGRSEGVRIEVDRGTGKWELMAFALRPDTTDPEPYPATFAKWRYRAMYIFKGKPHGQWSAIPSTTVGG